MKRNIYHTKAMRKIRLSLDAEALFLKKGFKCLIRPRHWFSKTMKSRFFVQNNISLLKGHFSAYRLDSCTWYLIIFAFTSEIYGKMTFSLQENARKKMIGIKNVRKYKMPGIVFFIQYGFSIRTKENWEKHCVNWNLTQYHTKSLSHCFARFSMWIDL